MENDSFWPIVPHGRQAATGRQRHFDASANTRRSTSDEQIARKPAVVGKREEALPTTARQPASWPIAGSAGMPIFRQKALRALFYRVQNLHPTIRRGHPP